MSNSMRILTLILFCFYSIACFAQKNNFQYQLEGTYPANLPGLSETQNVRFTLQWNEKDQMINGIYRDSFFTAKSPVTGTIGIQGRVFNVTLPRVIQNITNLFIISNTGFVGVAMKDYNGANVNQVFIHAAVTNK